MKYIIPVLLSLTLLHFEVVADYKNSKGQIISKLRLLSGKKVREEKKSVEKEMPTVTWSEATAERGKKLENTLMLIQKFEKVELDTNFDTPNIKALPKLRNIDQDTQLKLAHERRLRREQEIILNTKAPKNKPFLKRVREALHHERSAKPEPVQAPVAEEPKPSKKIEFKKPKADWLKSFFSKAKESRSQVKKEPKKEAPKKSGVIRHLVY